MIKFRQLSCIILASSFVWMLAGCNTNNSEAKAKSSLEGAPVQQFENQNDSKFLEDVFGDKTDKSRDLAEIKESGVLRAVTLYGSTAYFLYRGQTMGFEFELMENLAQYLDVNLEVVVAKNNLDLAVKLHNGEADLIAYGLTITNRRKKFVNFTDYLYLTQQVLVQRKPENWRKMKLHEIEHALISDNVELIGEKVSIRGNSAYMFRINNLMEELGDDIYIDTMPLNYETERLIEMVVDGKIKYTVADNNIAAINASYYPELDVKTPMSFSQRIAWAVSKQSPELLDTLNIWLATVKRTADFNLIYNRYFENKKDFRKRIDDDFFSLESGKISLYDDVIKEQADKYNLDWRLLSSVVYQESQFNPKAESWAGAKGLMQLMPATAKELGVIDRSNAKENLEAGIKYLDEMWNKWDDIPDSIQRIKFSLASYNCGYYHVRDAQRLAEKDQVEHLVWDDNIDIYLLRLSDAKYYSDPVVHYGYVRGIEPYTYVFEIFERYDHYQKFVPENSQD